MSTRLTKTIKDKIALNTMRKSPINKPVTRLPAMRTDQLNKMIGLPTPK